MGNAEFGIYTALGRLRLEAVFEGGIRNEEGEKGGIRKKTLDPLKADGMEKDEEAEKLIESFVASSETTERIRKSHSRF